jgi:hypothetical protein
VGHGGQCLCGAGEEQQQKIVVVEPKLSCRNKCAKTTITTVATAAPSRPHQHRRKYDPFATHRKQSQWQQSISAEIRSDLTSLPVCTAHTHTHTHTCVVRASSATTQCIKHTFSSAAMATARARRAAHRFAAWSALAPSLRFRGCARSGVRESLAGWCPVSSEK